MVEYYKQGVQYLAPVTITEDNKEIVLSVSDEEFENHKLEYHDSQRVLAELLLDRPVTFRSYSRIKKRDVTVKVLCSLVYRVCRVHFVDCGIYHIFYRTSANQRYGFQSL